MKLSTPARIGLRTVALLYLTVLLVVPIVTILWRTFEPGFGAFWASIRTPAAIAALNGLAAARGRVEELLGTVGFSPDDLYDMCLAVGEALGNAVDHTCEGGILATVSAYPDRAIVEVTDCGSGFSLEFDEPEVPLSAERGRGIKLMRLLTDSLVISRKSTGGTASIISSEILTSSSGNQMEASNEGRRTASGRPSLSIIFRPAGGPTHAMPNLRTTSSVDFSSKNAHSEPRR